MENLLTEDIKKLFREQYPLYSQEHTTDPKVVVKFFNPCGRGTWYITEGKEEPDGDWLFFGLCHIYESEFGYVTLSQLKDVQLPFGLTIERDIHFNGNISDAYNELLNYSL